MFLHSWLFTLSKVISTCIGELDKYLSSWFSVCILRGIKFSIAIFNGLISCRIDLSVSMTKIFSFDKTEYAGNVFGILSGIIVPPLFIVTDILYIKYGKNSIFSHEIIFIFIFEQI